MSRLKRRSARRFSTAANLSSPSLWSRMTLTSRQPPHCQRQLFVSVQTGAGDYTDEHVSATLDPRNHVFLSRCGVACQRRPPAAPPVPAVESKSLVAPAVNESLKWSGDGIGVR